MEFAIVAAILALFGVAGLVVKRQSDPKNAELEERSRADAVGRSAQSVLDDTPRLAGPLPSKGSGAHSSGREPDARPLSSLDANDEPSTGGYRLAGQRADPNGIEARIDSLRLTLEGIATKFMQAYEGDKLSLEDVLSMVQSAKPEMLVPLLDKSLLAHETYVIANLVRLGRTNPNPIHAGERTFTKVFAPRLVAATYKLGATESSSFRSWLLPSLIARFIDGSVQPGAWQAITYVIASANTRQQEMLERIMELDEKRDEIAESLPKDPGTRAALSYEATMARAERGSSQSKQKNEKRGRSQLNEANRSLDRIIKRFHPNRGPALLGLQRVAKQLGPLLAAHGFDEEAGALADGVRFVAESPPDRTGFLAKLAPDKHVATTLALARSLLSGAEPHRSPADSTAWLDANQLAAFESLASSDKSSRFLAHVLATTLRDPSLDLRHVLDVPRLYMLAGEPALKEYFFQDTDNMAWWLRSDELSSAGRFASLDDKRERIRAEIEAANKAGNMTEAYRARAELKREGLDQLPETAEEAARAGFSQISGDRADVDDEDDAGVGIDLGSAAGAMSVLRALRDGVVGKAFSETEQPSPIKPAPTRESPDARLLASAFDVDGSLVQPTTPRQRFVVRRVAQDLDEEATKELLDGTSLVRREFVLLHLLTATSRAPVDVAKTLGTCAKGAKMMIVPVMAEDTPSGLDVLFLPLVQETRFSDDYIPRLWLHLRELMKVATTEDEHALHELPNRMAEDRQGVVDVWTNAARLVSTDRRSNSSTELAEWHSEQYEARFFLDSESMYRPREEILKRILRWALEQCDLVPPDQAPHLP